MNEIKKISECVSELNQILSAILETPNDENLWKSLKNTIAYSKVNGYDIIQIPLTPITLDEPSFFVQPNINKLCQLLTDIKEKKMKAAKCQQYESAAGFRDQEKIYGRKLLELYKAYKGNDFGYFININEKIIVYINSWNNAIDNEVDLLINKI